MGSSRIGGVEREHAFKVGEEVCLPFSLLNPFPISHPVREYVVCSAVKLMAHPPFGPSLPYPPLPSHTALASGLQGQGQWV